MPLPDISHLRCIPQERWRALGAHLRRMGFVEAYAHVAAIGGQVFPPMCRPLRLWHLRRMDQPLGSALLLLSVQERVSELDAIQALGGDLVHDLLTAGLLARAEDGRVASLLKLGVFEETLFLADDLAAGGDAVMGAGSLTLPLLKAALPSGRRASAALEVGSGAAVNALCLARRVARVVATDINPRAVELAAVNAAINSVDNIEFRTGDLLDPVAGECFDLIISQPPFIPRPAGASPAIYMYGGDRGDELPLRLLARVSRHLTPRGRALIMSELPVFPADPFEKRVRDAVPEDASVLVLHAKGPDLDAFAVGDAAYEHPDFGPEYADKVVLRREHLAQLGVEDFTCNLIVIKKQQDRPGWMGAAEIAEMGPDADTVDSLVDGFDMLSRGREALLRARLRVRAGAAIAAAKDLARVIFPTGSALKEVVLDPGAARVVQILDAAPDVLAAARRFANETKCRPAEAADAIVQVIEVLIRAGVMVVA